ncbi:hypothetical protein [Roseivivax sp. CAU 1753]
MQSSTATVTTERADACLLQLCKHSGSRLSPQPFGTCALQSGDGNFARSVFRESPKLGWRPTAVERTGPHSDMPH